MAGEKKLKRIGKAPRVLLEVLGGFGKQGKTAVSFSDVRTGVNQMGYDLTRTDGTVMSVPDLNKAVGRAKNWLADQILKNPSPKVPVPSNRRRGATHEKPKRSNFPEDDAGAKEFKTKRDAYNSHRELVVAYLFDREDNNGIRIPMIKVSGDQFESSTEMYGWLNNVSGSAGDIF